MPTYSSNLAARLNGIATKSAWGSEVQAALGNTRRLRMFRDANAAAADPVATGTEFANIGSSGPLTMLNGNIYDFGVLSNASLHIAADISTGACALRLEGNGYWIQYTLGATNSGKEFTLNDNPTTSSGVAFAKGSGTKAPKFLDAGSGPTAPAVTQDMVAGFRLCDWSSGSRVVVGTSYFNFREPNLVMQHPWMSREMGDVRLMRVADGSGQVLGTGDDAFYFSGDILIGNPLINGEANVPLQEVEIRCRPYMRWASFPFKRDFRIAADITNPQAYKIELINGIGALVDVIESYSTRDANNTPGSGWPINDPRIKQDWNSGVRVQTHWNCFQTLNWCSHKPKIHSKAWHLLPGVLADATDPTNVAAFSSDNEQWPVITDNNSYNGLGSYRVSPKWSRAKDGGLDTTIVDTYFQQIGRENYITQATGYGYDPHSTGKHTWFMGPGGSRHDRAGWPHVLVMWASNPTGNRIHGNVPWRDMVHHWMLTYANHSVHYFTDVDKGYGIPKARVLAGDICYNDTYYSGGNENYRPNIATSAVRLLAVSNAGHTPFLDKYGHRFTAEYARDLMHNQSNSAVGAYLTLSPRAVLQARHFFTGAVLAAFDMTQSFPKENFMCRQHAWLNWQYVNMWIVSNEHADGFTMDEIETMWANHFITMYDSVYPEYVNQNTTFGITLKTLGLPLLEVPGSTTISLAPLTDAKAFYFAQVLLLMKQSGALAKMKAYSPKVSAAIDFLFTCLAKYCVDGFIDSNGRVDRVGSNGYYPFTDFTFTAGSPRYPSTWGVLMPPSGQLDWIRQSDGSIGSYTEAVDLNNTMHFRAQFLYILRDYTPEYQPLRFNQALALVDGWYSTVKASGNQFTFRFATFGVFKVPDSVGPSTLV